jgi:hypothetical protein
MFNHLTEEGVCSNVPKLYGRCHVITITRLTVSGLLTLWLCVYRRVKLLLCAWCAFTLQRLYGYLAPTTKRYPISCAAVAALLCCATAMQSFQPLRLYFFPEIAIFSNCSAVLYHGYSHFIARRYSRSTRAMTVRLSSSQVQRTTIVLLHVAISDIKTIPVLLLCLKTHGSRH